MNICFDPADLTMVRNSHLIKSAKAWTGISSLLYSELSFDWGTNASTPVTQNNI